MIQRLKGAIDSRIAEEQARQQRAAQATPSRSNSSARQTRNAAASPAGRQGRARKGAQPERDGTAGKPPVDPAEFENGLVEDSDEVPSRTGTPAQEKEKSEDGVNHAQEPGKPLAGDDNQSEDASAQAGGLQGPQELPADVRVKLRKLDKLEGRYNGAFHSASSSALSS